MWKEGTDWKYLIYQPMSNGNDARRRRIRIRIRIRTVQSGG
jgi:hypothetical protein